MRERANWATVAAIAAATAILFAGCGSDSKPPGAPPSPTPDAEAAYRQYRDAGKPFDCSTVFSDMDGANVREDMPALGDAAAKYRSMLSTWADQMGKIAFPAAARPTVDKVRELNLGEMRYLDSIAAVVDPIDGDALTIHVYFYDQSVIVELDQLATALGHPVSQAALAADRLRLVRDTYLRDKAWVRRLWNTALSRGDLNAAKAANRVEEDGLQRYLDSLGTIDWPAGFDGRVNELRDKIRAAIEFDRRQVDVASTAQITPPHGAPEFDVMDKTQLAMSDDLNKMDGASNSNAPQC